MYKEWGVFVLLFRKGLGTGNFSVGNLKGVRLEGQTSWELKRGDEVNVSDS